MNETNKIMWPIEQLKDSPINDYKDITPEKLQELADSLKEEAEANNNNGQLEAVIVDIRDDHYGEILSGKHTVMALRKNNEPMVWVEPIKPKNDAHAFRIAVKKNMEYATPVEERIHEKIEQYKDELNLEALEVTFDIGASLDTLIVEDEELEEVVTDDEEVQEAPKETEKKVDKPPITNMIKCPNCQHEWQPKSEDFIVKNEPQA